MNFIGWLASFLLDGVRWVATAVNYLATGKWNDKW